MLVRAAVVAVLVGLFACQRPPPSGTSSARPAAHAATAEEPRDASEPPATASAAPAPTPPPAAPGSAPAPERVTLVVTSASAEAQAATLEIDREGVYRFETSADAGASECTGTLPASATSALWRSVDAATFVPSEHGFAKAVQAPPQKGGGPPARYSVVRKLNDLALVPSTEAAARSLVGPIRATVSAAEKEASTSATCSRAGRR